MTSIEESPPAKGRPYESPLRERQAADTRRRILEAMRSLLAENAEDFDFPVQDAADRAGVSLRTVYRHFPTKADLLAALPEVVGFDTERFRPDSPAALADSVSFLFETMAANEALFRALTNSSQRARDDTRAARSVPYESALGELCAGLEPADAVKLKAVCNLLSSSAGLFYMQDRWSISTDDAADVAAWAISVLTDRAADTRKVSHDATE